MPTSIAQSSILGIIGRTSQASHMSVCTMHPLQRCVEYRMPLALCSKYHTQHLLPSCVRLTSYSLPPSLKRASPLHIVSDL